jgi:hypothetical protein
MSRALFILVTAFWLTMNVLLWQTEFGSRKNFGSVPAETVWEKILTAADDSSLTIYHHGKLVGAFHLQTEVSEVWSKIGDDNEPTRPPAKRGGYALQWDGTTVMPEWTNRLRFKGDLKLDKNRNCEELNSKVALRPMSWEIHTVAAERKIHLKMDDGQGASETVLQFSDLQNPVALASKLFGPSIGDAAGGLGLEMAPQNASTAALGIKWDAHEDSIRIGHSPVQVYRLHTRAAAFDVSLIVSRAGEILRMELPDGYLLVNDRMAITEERPAERRQTPVETK